MGFRLVPAIEGALLPWPRLRGVAFWTLLGGVLTRTAEVGASVLGVMCHRTAV